MIVYTEIRFRVDVGGRRRPRGRVRLSVYRIGWFIDLLRANRGGEPGKVNYLIKRRLLNRNLRFLNHYACFIRTCSYVMMCMHARSNNWMSQNVDKLNSSGNLKGTGGPPSFLTFPDMDRQRHLALAREPLTILFAPQHS